MTLNTPPHNEIIKDGINGWVLQCYHLPMTDNKSPIFDSAYFDPNDLASKIIEISNNDIVEKMIESLNYDFDNRIHIKYFIERFINSLDT